MPTQCAGGCFAAYIYAHSVKYAHRAPLDERKEPARAIIHRGEDVRCPELYRELLEHGIHTGAVNLDHAGRAACRGRGQANGLPFCHGPG